MLQRIVSHTWSELDITKWSMLSAGQASFPNVLKHIFDISCYFSANMIFWAMSLYQLIHIPIIVWLQCNGTLRVLYLLFNCTLQSFWKSERLTPIWAIHCSSCCPPPAVCSCSHADGIHLTSVPTVFHKRLFCCAGTTPNVKST